MISALTTVMAVSFLLTGCGDKAEHWAYNHEPEKDALVLYEDGRATLDGEEYTYTKNDTFISMTDGSGNTVDHRYVADEAHDQIYFYKPAVYHREEDGKGGGIVGLWIEENGRNQFQFSKEGTFSEENIFFGNYLIDKQAGTIKLMYTDPIEDTLLYYSQDGDELKIEYPWPMVRTSTGKDK
ncbi:MAG: hypothetical protein K6A71_08785 [Lachnospiraceae bacterium]|nr:hypothetical protein [Lachnospiraceae bacterium]